MNRLLIVIFLLALASEVFSQDRLPHFKDYPVSEAYTGTNAPLVLKRGDDKMFRTRLREASREKPNFAGHYILTAWGCGTSCLMGAVIDAKTGRVYWWNFTVCCWPIDVDDKFEPIEYRLNSSLIVFSGARNEKEDDVGAHFYKFDRGRFVHLRSILKEH
jgi:hypothetical protein